MLIVSLEHARVEWAPILVAFSYYICNIEVSVTSSFSDFLVFLNFVVLFLEVLAVEAGGGLDLLEPLEDDGVLLVDSLRFFLLDQEVERLFLGGSSLGVDHH